MPRRKNTPKNVVELKVEPDAIAVEPDAIAVEPDAIAVEPDTVAVEPDIKYKKIECPTCGASVLSKSMKKHLTSKKHLKLLE